MKKTIIYLILSCLIASGIEILYFNFDVIQSRMRADQVLVFEKQDLQYQNWTQNQNALISLPDPIIYADKLNISVYTMQVEMDINPEIETCTFFYTNKIDESFSAEKMMTVSIKDGTVDIPLTSGETIVAFRIDPGEEAGRTLNDIKIHINDISWNISISRIIAMLVIYWGTRWLMSLQRSPDYNVGNRKKEVE